MTEKKQALPGHETQSDEMNCPSCGRFVGAATKCGYCGAKVEKRMSLLAIRWAAILLATVGLFLLYLMAVYRDVPVVLLGNIQPTMNFGQIRVIGQAESDARAFRSGGGMGFNVSDGTDTMIVFISKNQVEELTQKNLIPKAGDAVDFVGSLSISDEKSSLRLLSVGDFHLTRAAAASVRLADVNDSLVGSSITITGKVLELVPTPADSKRPYTLKIADDSGEQSINFWQTEYDQIQNPAALAGAYVRARVSVASYQDKIQLKLASGLDLEILDAPPATGEYQSPAKKAAVAYQKEAPPRDFSRGRATRLSPLSVGEVTTALDGQTVLVRGLVQSVSAPEEGSKQPFSVILQDGDATLRVVYWSTVNDVITDKPAPGALFEMEGVVAVYKDTPQLKVESGYKVRKVGEGSPAAAPAAGAQIGSISAISAADKGQVRSVQGTLGPGRSLGKGTAYSLTDDTGSIDLILWDSIVPANVFASLREGVRVQATGEVGEYNGQMQLKASAGASVVVIP